MKRNTKTRFRRLCLLLPFLLPQINNSLGSLGRRIVSKRVGICVSTAGLDDNPVDAVRLFSRSVAPIKNTAGETDKHQIRDEDEFVHRVKTHESDVTEETSQPAVLEINAPGLKWQRSRGADAVYMMKN